MIQEKCREQNQHFYSVFFDLTKAFDSVDRNLLWSLLERIGCPPNFIRIVRSFHDGMCGRVSANDNLSAAFLIAIGLKQGCMLAPFLFILFYAAMLKEAMSKSKAGIYMRFRTSGKLFNLRRLKASTKVLEELMQDLLYADDCALCAHSEADLQELCNHFAEAARLFGLSINLSKTEVMHQRPPRDESVNQETNIKIGNVSLKEVPTFVYLGSTLSNDAMLDHEIATRIKKPAPASADYMTGSGRITV